MPRRRAPGFAGETDVPMDRSKAQIELLLQQHGADGYHTGWQAPKDDDPGWDAVEFLWKGKQIRFKIPRPDPNDVRVRAAKAPEPFMAQLNRQRWRILHLVIKAKLEAVEQGVSVFEEEFLAHIVTESGRTIGEILLPRIEAGHGQLRLEEKTK